MPQSSSKIGRPERLPASSPRPSNLPETFSPQLAILVDSPPGGDEWLHEIKFDGYRILGFVQRGKARLVTRNGNDWTAKFPAVAKALAALKVDSAIIDGEVVVLDAEGRSDFQALQAIVKDKMEAEPRLYAFDLPFHNGTDLTSRTLVERKKILQRLLDTAKVAPAIEYSRHVVGDGDKFLAEACKLSLEGIISKRVDALYVSRREPTWVKSKCQQRQEFVVIGFTDPEGNRIGFGSLLLGYHDSKKRLVYAGRVGTGFGGTLLQKLHVRLLKLKRKDPPTDVEPPRRERRNAHWVKPALVAEVRFTGWTRDGMLRHPAFIALRSDKPPSQVVRESPVASSQIEKVIASRPHPPAADPKATATRPKKAASRSGDGTIAGVRLTHPDKVLYPDNGVTKEEIAQYYVESQRWMLPHVLRRPLAIVRCPAGQSSKCFFQRNWSNTLPEAVGKVNVSETVKKREEHIGITDLKGLLSLVQISVLEVHTWNCHEGDVEHPDQLIFDLDPGPGLTWKRVVEGARLLNRTLADLGLSTFLKTSGGKGLHIIVPIKPTIDWETAKNFTGTIANTLAQSNELFVANMRKDLRPGKIYIDYHRNGRGAMAIAPYSTRAREGAPVSMPITWEELKRLPSASHFTVQTTGTHLRRRKLDPWRDFQKSRVDLLKITNLDHRNR